MSQERAFQRLAWTVSTTYVVVASTWILGTSRIVDPVAVWMGFDPEQIEVGKGLLFVAVTGLLLLVSVSWFAKRLGVEQRAWAALAETTRDGLLLYKVDAAGRTHLRFANDALLRMTGVTREQVTGDPRLLIERVDAPHAADLRHVEDTGGSVERRLEVAAADGSRRWVYLSGTVLQRGRNRYVQWVMVDLEEQRARERALRETLEVQKAARREAERNSRLRASFLTAVSHELRTPVAVVAGMVETLHTHRERMDATQRAAAEDALLRHAQRLRRTTIDLLDVDRLTADHTAVTIESVDLAALLRGACAGSPVAPRITVTAPEQLLVAGDAVLLTRLADNLLSNVHKYAPQGPVQVRLTADAHQWQLEVSDTGPGVPPEELERIFVPFHRVDHEHPQPGTGVGLPLVRAFAHAHGGEVTANLDDGLRITVTAPLDAVKAAA